MTDPLHTIIARQNAGNAYFLIITVLIVFAIVGVGMLETIPEVSQ